ncbi:hypothetical protein K488DRAFT_87059 [Vararia minispora EC-137]|uniref:Uncharacterized protein n=1 Tax=Vararia minispora EC-137 TaxID=1314806 RepID=A0ACB8QHF2_9AGAM|nr:hypothetical protein K488DRAFT_87059 [Vararia minispora EC-137]
MSCVPAELKEHPLLFTLSASVHSDVLAGMVAKLSSLSKVGSVGCLSSSLPGLGTACSLAWLDRARAVTFRSDIPGRPRVQVGRRRETKETVSGEGEVLRRVAAGGVSWPDLWDRRATERLPGELQALRPEDIHSVIVLTDDAPQGLAQALTAFPNANKLGMTAAPTPFVTGRPYTLMRDGEVFSRGAVGIALLGPPRPSLKTRYHNLYTISDTMVVTGAEGNLVHTLDGKNPSQLLLDSIKRSGVKNEDAKEDSFYVGVLEDGQLVKAFSITSGDPKRGTVALEADAAPPLDARVQLFHRSRKSVATAETWEKRSALCFMTTGDEDGSSADEPHTLEDVFLSSSEKGFVCSRVLDGRPEEWWSSTVPGGVASLEW